MPAPYALPDMLERICEKCLVIKASTIELRFGGKPLRITD